MIRSRNIKSGVIESTNVDEFISQTKNDNFGYIIVKPGDVLLSTNLSNIEFCTFKESDIPSMVKPGSRIIIIRPNNDYLTNCN